LFLHKYNTVETLVVEKHLFLPVNRRGSDQIKIITPWVYYLWYF